MGLRAKLLVVLHVADEDGAPSEVMKWQKGCALLTYLIVTGQPQRREHLADLLWDAASTTQSLQNLRKLLSRLRKWVPALDVTRQQVAFPVETAAAIDYLSLRQALDEGSMAEIAAVLPLYEGDLLDGFYVPDAPRFNEWLLLEREHLRQRVTAAYRQLCWAYSEREAWEKGIAAAQRWLALDPIDEEALRFLMQLLAASGQVEVALQQYATSRQILWDELGVEPAPETVQLVQRLQTLKDEHGGGLSWAAIVGAQVEWPSPDQLAEPGLLPSQAMVPYQRNNDFTGRRESLLRLAKLLLPDEGQVGARAVAITGMGGLGKTQLAVEFCYRYGRYFPGGIYWLSFADAENVAEEVTAVGGERGMGLYRDADKLTQIDKVGRVRRAWQEAIPRLLIFDNCEDEALLAEWLPVTGGCRVLLTSRRGQWAQAMGVVVHSLNTLSRDESVALLAQLAPDVAAKAGPIIQDIAAELGDLPLALHLAGSFLRRYEHITPQQYLAQLDQMGVLHHPSLEGRGSSYSPTQHELNIGRTFAINFEQLNPLDDTDIFARKLLVHAACFAPGEPIPNELLLKTVSIGEEDLLAQLLATDGLARLVGLGFVRVAEQKAVVMHRLIAKYIQDVLADAATQTAVEQTIIETATEHSQSSWSLLAHQKVPAAHLRYMMERALPQQDQHSARLLNLWGRYLRDVGDYETAEQKLLEAQQIWLRLFGPNHPESAESFFQLGRLYIRMGKYEQSRANYEQYLSFWQKAPTPDMVKIARVYHSLGTLLIGLGDFESARSYLEQALDLRIKHLGSSNLYVGFTLVNLGALYYDLGDFAAAQAVLHKALPIVADAFGEMTADMANVYGNLGKVYLGMDDLENAWSFTRKACHIRQEVLGEEHLETAFSYANLSKILMHQGKYEEALAYGKSALKIREEALHAEHPHLASSYQQIGRLLLQTGEPHKALSYLEQTLAIREQVLGPTHPTTASVLIDLGEWREAQSEHDTAQLYYKQALAILRGQVAETHSDLKRAQRHLEQVKQHNRS